jgi:polyferredoxin
MALGQARMKALGGLGRKRARAHRYTLWRWGVALAFSLGIAALPAFGILRFDLWSGRNESLGQELGLVEVARRFAFPFLAINLVIVLVTHFYGRYLCGFVCPYGSVARLAEFLRFRARSRHQRALAFAAVLAVTTLLSAITFAFWVDPRVFVAGSPGAIALALVFLLGMIGTFTWCVTRLGLRFCRDVCPSGVYFALLGHETRNGVAFASPATCIECDACDRSCPMDLAPRELLTGPARGGSGFYPDGTTNVALCIRCGDCVVACEGVTAGREGPTPLRMGPLGDARATETLGTGASRT